jgi:hypothetical protein
MHDQKLVVFAFMAIFVSYCPLFGFLGWFSRPMTLGTYLTGMTKNSSILHLWPFTWPVTLSTCLRGMTKNSSFLHFRAVFMSYCPLFWGLRGDLQGPWHSLHVSEACPKTCHFCVYGPFRELLPTVLGFRGNLQFQWHSVHVWKAWPKTRRFCVSGRFMSYCPQSWVSEVIYKAHDTQYMFGRHD